MTTSFIELKNGSKFEVEGNAFYHLQFRDEFFEATEVIREEITGKVRKMPVMVRKSEVAKVSVLVGG